MAPKLFRVRPVVLEDAPEDKTLVLLDKDMAQKMGIELDEVGFPTPAGLEAWHKLNNPQFFMEGEDEEG